jgi:hypothetical protein
LVTVAPIQLPMATAFVAGLRVPDDPPPRTQIPNNIDASLQRGLRHRARDDWTQQTVRRDGPGVRANASDFNRNRQEGNRPAALSSRSFAPFLAQQAAQAGTEDADAGDDEMQLQRGIAAYLLAASDDSTLMGPVRPTDLVI